MDRLMNDMKSFKSSFTPSTGNLWIKIHNFILFWLDLT
jgi:hypothetical protein